jgi:hypothetical protein
VIRNGNGFACGDTAVQIRHGEPPVDSGGMFTGIVPDGVSSVSLVFGGTTHAVHPVAAPVRDNFYAVRVPLAAPNNQPSVIKWLAADGRVSKTVTVPNVAALRNACRDRPVACAPMRLSASSSSATTAKLTPAP